MEIFTDITSISGKKGIQLPENLAWDFDFENSVLEAIHSKNKRKFLRKTGAILKDLQIEQRVNTIESEDQFQFLLHFFEKTHLEKKHEYMLHEEWYEKKKSQGRTPESLELWRNDELIGMKMYSYGDGFYLSHKATTREFDVKCNVGLIIDYLVFLRAQDLGYRHCETGMGKNLFGIYLQLSLYEYKVSLGLKMRPARSSRWQKLQFNDAPITEPFIVYCMHTNVPHLYYVYPDGSEPGPLNKYKPINIEISGIPYSQFIKLES